MNRLTVKFDFALSRPRAVFAFTMVELVVSISIMSLLLVAIGSAALVFNEVRGLVHLADVVVVAGDLCEQRVGADHLRRLLGRGGRLQARSRDIRGCDGRPRHR